LTLLYLALFYRLNSRPPQRVPYSPHSPHFPVIGGSISGHLHELRSPLPRPGCVHVLCQKRYSLMPLSLLLYSRTFFLPWEIAIRPPFLLHFLHEEPFFHGVTSMCPLFFFPLFLLLFIVGICLTESTGAFPLSFYFFFAARSAVSHF